MAKKSQKSLKQAKKKKSEARRLSVADEVNVEGSKVSKKKKPKRKPSSLGKDGRNSNGQFTKGNTLSIGNNGGGNKEKAKKLKRALIEAVTEEDIKAIVKKMKRQAKAGDAAARKELFDRLWGRAIQEVDLGETAAKTLVDIAALIGVSTNG